MKRRQQRLGRREPDWAWMEERLTLYCQRRGLMKADGEPNWAAVGRRIGGSDAMVSGWIKDHKWPDADSVLAIAHELNESTTTWLARTGFLLDIPPSKLSPAMEKVVRVMGEYPPDQQEHLVQLVEDAHTLVSASAQGTGEGPGGLENVRATTSSATPTPDPPQTSQASWSGGHARLSALRAP